jgi:hypothetical protein
MPVEEPAEAAKSSLSHPTKEPPAFARGSFSICFATDRSGLSDDRLRRHLTHRPPALQRLRRLTGCLRGREEETLYRFRHNLNLFVELLSCDLTIGYRRVSSLPAKEPPDSCDLLNRVCSGLRNGLQARGCGPAGLSRASEDGMSLRRKINEGSNTSFRSAPRILSRIFGKIRESASHLAIVYFANQGGSDTNQA